MTKKEKEIFIFEIDLCANCKAKWDNGSQM